MRETSLKNTATKCFPGQDGLSMLYPMPWIGAMFFLSRRAHDAVAGQDILDVVRALGPMAPHGF